MIWNKARECMSRDELASLQGKRLAALVEHMYQGTEYYRKKMQETGLEPGDIRGIEDLDKLPFTTKEDLFKARPSGMFAVPESEIVRYHASDILAGVDTRVGYTGRDIDIWSECVARSLSMAGLGKGDVIQIAYHYGLSADGPGAHCGAGKVGAVAVPASLSQISEVTGIMGPPSYLMRVAQMVEKRGMKNTLRLKAAVCGAEAWTEDMREKVQDTLGIRVYDIYGTGELMGLGVACECGCQNGMHIQEDFFLAEVLDTDTLIAVTDGMSGELVFTTLQKEGLPLIRYRTMNITRLYCEKCECGRTMARIDRVCEGAGGVLLIRGKSVFLFRLESALAGLQDMDASYIIYIRKEHNLDVVDICVDFCMERGGNPVTQDREAAMRRVADAVRGIIGLEPKVYFAENGMVRTSAGRKVTIVDERREIIKN